MRADPARAWLRNLVGVRPRKLMAGNWLNVSALSSTSVMFEVADDLPACVVHITTRLKVIMPWQAMPWVAQSSMWPFTLNIED
jgi:hypothetical protein